MSNENRDVRDYAASRGVRMWEIAEKFGVAEATFSRKMRKKFSEKEKNKAFKYIDEIHKSHIGLEVRKWFEMLKFQEIILTK